MKTRLTLLAAMMFAIAAPVKGQVYDSIFDDTVKKKNVKIKRVAVIPNRLPLTIAEPERWRKFNWELIAYEFTSRGFEVVDYDTTLEGVRKANLPLEDTGSSEQKFSRAARVIDADILVMPYYSTSFDMQSVVIINKANFTSTVSLQIYSRKENKFFYRADSSGMVFYQTGWGIAAGMIIMMAGSVGGTSDAGLPDDFDPNDSSTWNTSTTDSGGMSPAQLGSLIMLGGTLVDLIQAMQPKEKRWQKAFRVAVSRSLEPFFSVYSAGGAASAYCGKCGAKNKGKARPTKDDIRKKRKQERSRKKKNRKK